jgi:hypothetical protein
MGGYDAGERGFPVPDPAAMGEGALTRAGVGSKWLSWSHCPPPGLSSQEDPLPKGRY